MTRNTLIAVFAAAMSLLPGIGSAQTTTPAASVEVARQLLNNGRPGEALTMLRGLPPSVEGTRLRVDGALAIGDFSQAVRAYEDLVTRFKSPSPDVLAAIATARAVALRKDADPDIRVSACEALLWAGQSAECVAELQATANDVSAGFENRLSAARVLFEHRATGAAALLDFVIQHGIQNSPATTADALSRLPPAVSNEPLKRLLSSENADAQYLAAIAIGRRRLPDAAAPLRALASDTEAGAARLMAYVGLAALGEPDGLRVVRETLPLMKGRDRLEAARALIVLKDPAAPRILDELLTDDRETLRIEAAEFLYSTQSSRAASVLTSAVQSSNAWVRVAAIDAAARIGMPLTRGVRSALADSNSRIASAAARAILRDLRSRR